MTDRRDSYEEHLGPEVLDHLAEGREVAAEARSHLSACRECRGELEWLRGFRASVAHVPEHRPSEGFVDRVMDHVSLPSPAGARSFRPGWLQWSGWAAAGVASMAAVTAALGWLWIVSRPEVSVGMIAGLAFEAAQSFLVSVALRIGEFLVASGIAPFVGELLGGMSTTSALGTMGVLGVLGLATGAAAVHILRMPPALHTVKGA